MFEQMSIFDFIEDPKGRIFKIDKKIRLIEMFGGIGSQSLSLRDMGANYESWKLIEFDKFPVKSYNAIHNSHYEPVDIRNVHGRDLEIVDTDKYCYICCYSFPCQDLSVAGKGKGMSKGSGTRSGLLWEVERILTELQAECLDKPQVLLMENVPNVHGKANYEDFSAWLNFLESIGYSNYWKDLNAADYGVAQSRKRCFCVSILGNYTYNFPEPIPLKKRMKDYLEDKVDERFYIKNEKARELIEKLIVDKKILDIKTDETESLTNERTNERTNDRSNCLINQNLSTEQTHLWQEKIVEYHMSQVKAMESAKLGCMSDKDHQSTSVYSTYKCSPTLDATGYKHATRIVECKEIKNYENDDDF